MLEQVEPAPKKRGENGCLVDSKLVYEISGFFAAQESLDEAGVRLDWDMTVEAPTNELFVSSSSFFGRSESALRSFLRVVSMLAKRKNERTRSLVGESASERLST